MPDSLDRETLVQETANLASTYIREGVRLSTIEADDPVIRIDRIEELLRRYFVLTGLTATQKVDPGEEQADPDVVPFVRKLPGRVRRLKTTTVQQTEVTRGEIRGRVDWQETIKRRSRRGAGGATIFACQQVSNQYDTAENRILATLIKRIRDVIYDDFETALENPDRYVWLSEWVAPDSQLRQIIDELHLENPYLSEISVSEDPVPKRTLEEVSQSRNPMYREAAKLLMRYQALQRGEFTDEDVQELFNSLFVTSEHMETVFELYWAYKLLETFEEAVFKVVGPGTNEMARWRHEGSEYRLFWQTGGTLDFTVSLEDASAELDVLDHHFPDGTAFMHRKRAAIRKEQRAKQELLGMDSGSTLWSGVPDLLVEKRDTETNELTAVFVGEVKYSGDLDNSRAIRNQAANGLEDLSEYIELLQTEGIYLASDQGISPEIVGAVFTVPFDRKQEQIDNIQLVTYGEDVNCPF